MTDRSEWEGRVGRRWAEEWRRTDRSFAGVTERLMARLGDEPSPRAILDIGCGAGELSFAAARTCPSAQIVGVDVSDTLIAVACERGDQLANASFEVADAASWSRDGFFPDLLVSRHGVMFFADPAAAFAHLRSIAASRARLIFSCFRGAEFNAWASDLVALLPGNDAPLADPRAPGPFAFADPDYVADILSAAGWDDIGFEPVDFAYVAGAGENAVDDALSYFLSIGPASRAAAALDPAQRADFVERLRSYLSERDCDGIVAMPGAAWIVSAASG